MKSFVSISNDRSFAETFHESLLGPPTPCTEALTTMFWPPGLLNGLNQLTHTVRHQRLPICLALHDIGPGILHASKPPSPWDATAPLDSFRKHLFFSSRHRANGKGLAACGLNNLAPTPALACGFPAPVPAIGNVTMALLNNVLFTLTPDDISEGKRRLAEAVAVAAVGSVAGTKGKLVGWAFKTLAENAKNIGYGVRDYIMEDGPVEIEFRVEAPVMGSYWSVGFGIRRGEDGEHDGFASAKLAGHEVGGEMDLGWPPTLPDPYYKEHADMAGDDVVVEKDGKQYRYHGGDLNELPKSPQRPDNWGKVTPEGDD